MKEAEEQYFNFRDPIDLRLGELIAELRDAVNPASIAGNLQNGASKTNVDPQDVLKLILWQESYVADILDAELYMPSVTPKAAEVESV